MISDMSAESTVRNITRKLKKIYMEHTFDREDFNPLSEFSSSDTLSPPPFEATCISPVYSPMQVYLGSVSDAMYPAALVERDITGILNVAGQQCLDIQRMQRLAGSDSQWTKTDFSKSGYVKSTRMDSFEFFRVDAEDNSRYDILSDLKPCMDWLRERESLKTRAVLVHCIQGLNRSAAVCAAWLVERFSMDAETAILHIACKRKGVLSNKSFVKQLVTFTCCHAEQGSHKKVETRKSFSIGNVSERKNLV